MSDSRFHLKVEFEIYGQKFTWNPSLNWYCDDDGFDSRIKDWFVECYEAAYSKYRSDNEAYFRKKRQVEIEMSERAELRLLQRKYPNG